MINFKQAIAAAQMFAAEIFPAIELKGLRVESINKSDDLKYWYVTLGWVAADTRVLNTTSAVMMMPTRPDLVEAPRVYKKFTIDAESSEMVSMTEGS
jgi:hypothetical protein